MGHSLALAYEFFSWRAILDILLISGGEQMLRGRLSWLGYATCFSGNVLLLGGMLLFALKLRRH